MVLDKVSASSDAFHLTREKLNLKILSPAISAQRVIAFLGWEYARRLLYSKEDTELLDIFSKQIAIAVENDMLTRNVRKLEVNSLRFIQ